MDGVRAAGYPTRDDRDADVHAGWYAVEWWRQDPASSARMVVTLLGCLVLAAAGLAMTAARFGIARERKRILRGGV